MALGLTWIERWQIEQGAVGDARQRLIQPGTKLRRVDLALADLGEYDTAGEYLATCLSLALALALHGALAGVETLLTKFQLHQAALQGRNLIIEFGHESGLRGQGCMNPDCNQAGRLILSYRCA